MTLLNDKKIKKAYEQAKAILEMEDVFLPVNVEDLLWKKAKGEILGPEFRRKILEMVKAHE